MLPLAGLLFNVVAGLVIDRAQNLAKDHVEKMIDDVLPDKAKKELDEIVKKDPTHTFTSAREALIGAIEGKLPINLKDGKILPIEMTVKVRFDPNTQSLEIVK
ncbi:MAG TPA: hypothetical protein EYF95_06455 [Flavobacteriales bacterium]|jgi:hypothetical protein|nr:hypothetical protein [Flavobacteriales bacterium]